MSQVLGQSPAARATSVGFETLIEHLRGAAGEREGVGRVPVRHGKPPTRKRSAGACGELPV
jgi:hypothetical protein